MKKFKNIFWIFLLIAVFSVYSNIIYAVEKIAPQDDMVNIDFSNTDVKLVIKYLSELTGQNFVIDEIGGVRGSITVISPKKMAKKDAAKVIESILELNGFSLIPSDKLIRVVNKRKAREQNIATEMGKENIPEDDKVITQLIPLNYAKATDIEKAIVPLISKDSNITVYTPINLLIITEVASNIHRLLKIIENLDVHGAEIKTTLIPIKYASAKTIAGHITTVFGDPQAQQMQQAHRQAGVNVPQGEKRLIKTVADDRTNTVVLLANEDDTKIIVDFVHSLDKDIDIGRDDIHVYYLENSDAEELAKVLANVPLVEKKPEPGQPQTQPRSGAGGMKPNIVADKYTNALIINEPPENYATIKKIISQLDIPRSQVLVEAAIVEMSIDKSLQVGVEWRSLNKPSAGVATAAVGSNFGLTQEGLASAPYGAQGLSVGLMKGWLDESKGIPNIGALLNLFKADSDFNILSTPQIVTMDNQEAEIVVSDVIPFVTNSRVTDTNNVIKTYDYKDVGITLKITPHINKQTKMVRMDILQEISKVIDASVTEAVRTSKRKAKTAVIVHDEKTIVIGGLIRNDKTFAESKIPLLGDIPFLGILFKRKKEVNSKTNLMIFITPHIISNSSDFDSLTIKKRNQLQDFMDENRGIKTLKKDTPNPIREPKAIDTTSTFINPKEQMIIDTTVISYDSAIVE